MTMPPPPPVEPTNSAAYAAAPGTFPGKTLGIVGLIVAIFFSLIGLILSLVARSQSKRAGFKNTPATVGIVIGIVFLLLQIIGIVVVSVVGVSAVNSACSSLGSGPHTLSNGTTFTCP